METTKKLLKLTCIIVFNIVQSGRKRIGVHFVLKIIIGKKNHIIFESGN